MRKCPDGFFWDPTCQEDEGHVWWTGEFGCCTMLSEDNTRQCDDIGFPRTGVIFQEGLYEEFQIDNDFFEN